MEKISIWMTKSGLKINVEKTEICIFHRRNKLIREIEIQGVLIKTNNTMNVLGMTFDSTMKWKEQVSRAVSEANSSLYAIRVIKKYFNPDEIKNLLTAIFYSRLYYGSEVWHIPGLELAQCKSLKFASANAIRNCLPGYTIMNTHTEIHNLAKRALPAKMCMYKHAIMMYKLMKCELCEDEFLQLNFQLNHNARLPRMNFLKRQRFDVGKNVLLNRMSCLNNMIEKSWLDLGLNSYKLKCKGLFLSQ